jgi:hypothetical protein
MHSPRIFSDHFFQNIQMKEVVLVDAGLHLQNLESNELARKIFWNKELADIKIPSQGRAWPGQTRVFGSSKVRRSVCFCAYHQFALLSCSVKVGCHKKRDLSVEKCRALGIWNGAVYRTGRLGTHFQSFISAAIV